MPYCSFIRVSCTVALLAVGSVVSPLPAEASPADEPAIDQYADPFGPLPTGERALEFNPFSNQAALPPPRLLRQLLRVDEANRAPLVALVSQVATARERVKHAADAAGSSPVGDADAVAVDAGAVDAVADSLFDLRGAGGWLLAAGGTLAVVAAAQARRRLVRDRQGIRRPD